MKKLEICNHGIIKKCCAACNPSEPPVRWSDMVSCAWSNRELDGSCNVCQRRDDPKVILVTLPTMSFRVCGACAALLLSKLERTANADISGGAK